MTKFKNSKTIKNIPTKSIRDISEDYLNNRNNMPLPHLTAETKNLVKKGTTLKNEFKNLTKMKKWGGTKKRKNKRILSKKTRKNMIRIAKSKLN